MKQIKITRCTNSNKECVNECFGKWWDAKKGDDGYWFITKPKYGCDLVSRQGFSQKDFEVRDKPQGGNASFTGKTFCIPIIQEKKEVKKMLSVYHVIAWHKDKNGDRVALAYHGWVKATSPANATVKAVLDTENWTGKNNTNPDDFIWQIFIV